MRDSDCDVGFNDVLEHEHLGDEMRFRVLMHKLELSLVFYLEVYTTELFVTIHPHGTLFKVILGPESRLL